MNKKEMYEQIKRINDEKVLEIYNKMEIDKAYTSEEIFELCDKGFFPTKESATASLTLNHNIHVCGWTPKRIDSPTIVIAGHKKLVDIGYYKKCDKYGNILDGEVHRMKNTRYLQTYKRVE